MFMPRQLSHTLDQIARQSLGKDWGLYAALLDHWREIVSDEYAKVTTPVKMVFPHQPNEARRRNGTLTVRLPKGLAMEFTYKTEQIRQRINSYFGYDAVGRIVFDPVFGTPPAKTTPKTADPAALEAIRQQANTIEDNELQNALQTFGEAILVSKSNLV